MKNTTNNLNAMFECYIPKETWPFILRVNIKYQERKALKWLSLFGIKWFRAYVLKVTYKDNKVKNIPIPKEEKDILKANVMKFNFYLASL